ncbi:hypothetical protein KP509_34G035000 [Ceratopteris richardii]|uniref:Uncharacterized protein n=1 Tax=Ceratopteris richardii TaxID=49495 RepID=A0A8T2QIM8_CERRI|nr:hypothetical protein KP509_34G035000 [Ceratopteris richardii]
MLNVHSEVNAHRCLDALGNCSLRAKQEKFWYFVNPVYRAAEESFVGSLTMVSNCHSCCAGPPESMVVAASGEAMQGATFCHGFSLQPHNGSTAMNANCLHAPVLHNHVHGKDSFIHGPVLDPQPLAMEVPNRSNQALYCLNSHSLCIEHHQHGDNNDIYYPKCEHQLLALPSTPSSDLVAVSEQHGDVRSMPYSNLSIARTSIRDGPHRIMSHTPIQSCGGLPSSGASSSIRSIELASCSCCAMKRMSTRSDINCLVAPSKCAVDRHQTGSVALPHHQHLKCYQQLQSTGSLGINGTCQVHPHCIAPSLIKHSTGSCLQNKTLQTEIDTCKGFTYADARRSGTHASRGACGSGAGRRGGHNPAVGHFSENHEDCRGGVEKACKDIEHKAGDVRQEVFGQGRGRGRCRGRAHCGGQQNKRSRESNRDAAAMDNGWRRCNMQRSSTDFQDNNNVNGWAEANNCTLPSMNTSSGW